MNLIDTENFVLDGIFDGGDVDLRCIESLEEGVESSGFTRTGGAGDENHAEGLFDG